MPERIEVAAIGANGCSALKVTDSARLWRYFHETYCVTLVTRGFGRWRYRGCDDDVSPERLMLMEPGEVHANTKVEEPGSFFAVFFPGPLVQQISEQLDTRMRHFRIQSLGDPEALRAFTSLLATPDDGCADTQEQQLSLALAGAFRTGGEAPYATPARAATHVRRGARLLRESFEAAPWQTIHIGSVAELVGMNYHWFIHSFTAEFGIAPYQYVKALRLSRARDLLARGPTERASCLRDIAISAGFSDAPHMSRQFRAEYGMPLKEFAANVNPRWCRNDRSHCRPAARSHFNFQ